MKKLLLIVVDALASRVLISAMQSGKLPNISALAKAGSLSNECSAIFPSITPAATSSLVTGCYPRDHGIPGAFWYDDEKGDVAYYGSDLWVIVNEGINTFFEDFLIHLNQQKLKVETLFQTVERAGLQAGCLNYIIFHGDVRHRVDVPLVLDVIPGVPSKEDIYGPSILYLGDFVGAARETDHEAVHRFGIHKAAKVFKDRARAGMFDRFGMEDDYTARTLIHLAQRRALPDFTVAYFPDNDFQSHEVGPHAAVTVLESFDTKLGELFAVYGRLEKMLQELCIVITGDHSQSDVQPDEEEAGIRLDELLKHFHLVDPGTLWDADDELMVCPNMGAAQIYFRDPRPESIKRVIWRLLDDPRVDQIIWRAEFTEGNVPGYRIVTHRRGSLHFWAG
ncbi:MAG TPA: alkaline phosphatase family protein, partial [Thermodesulfobacteriota bacterium]|nr:alkaline phosphatase family protein [Thermodesulfobacteriota bacterium]